MGNQGQQKEDWVRKTDVQRDIALTAIAEFIVKKHEYSAENGLGQRDRERTGS